MSRPLFSDRVQLVVLLLLPLIAAALYLLTMWIQSGPFDAPGGGEQNLAVPDLRSAV
jgi:hypothetical protein